MADRASTEVIRNGVDCDIWMKGGFVMDGQMDILNAAATSTLVSFNSPYMCVLPSETAVATLRIQMRVKGIQGDDCKTSRRINFKHHQLGNQWQQIAGW